MPLVKLAVAEAVEVRGYRLNFATQACVSPCCEPNGVLYLPPLGEDEVDMGPLWDFVRDTHGPQIKRYLAMKRLLERLTRSA